MDTRIIKPEDLEKAVMKALGEYGDKVLEVTEAEVKATGRLTVKALKGSAPTGGSYAKGWSHKVQKGSVYRLSDTVYNRTDYQLTHLLEKPHATGRYKGGKYPKNVDYTGTMERIESEYTNRFYQEVLNKL